MEKMSVEARLQKFSNDVAFMVVGHIFDENRKWLPYVTPRYIKQVAQVLRRVADYAEQHYGEKGA